MATTLVSHENNKAVYTTAVEYNVFEQAMDAAFRKNRNKFRIPGFRKGHATRKLIESFYGKTVFYDDALNEILPDAIESATKELGLEPIGRPDVDVKTLEVNQPVVFEVTTETMPHPTLGDYKSIELERKDDTVTDEEVDVMIEQERKKDATLVEVTDRAAQTGDTATIDFEGFHNGVAFDGGKGENFDLKLGSGTFIPGFEEQVAGHSTGESFDVNVTFPKEYQEKTLAGKEAVFHVTIHKLMEEQLPTLDDEFAKDVSEFDTLDEYRDSVRQDLEKKKAEHNRTLLENEAVQKLIKISDIHAPRVMVDEQVEEEVRNFANQLQQMGITLKAYTQYTHASLSDVRENVRPQAEMRVNGDLALTSLIDAESISVTPEELEAEIHRVGTQYGAKDPEEFAKRVKELGNASVIELDLKKRKAIDRLMEYVTLVDKVAEESSVEEGETAESTAATEDREKEQE